MTISNLAAAFIEGNQAHTSGYQGSISRVVIHATVSRCERGGARGNANYFQSPDAGGLAHYVVDPGEIIACCQEETVAWHAPPNAGSIGIELCDPQGELGLAANAQDPNRWQDADHQAMLSLAAQLTADICGRRGIRMVHVDASALASGAWGIPGHLDVSQAWHQTDHADPLDGGGFDWNDFINRVNGGATPPPPQGALELTLPQCIDPVTGGTWTVMPDGGLYTDEGAPYVGALNIHPDWHTDTAVACSFWRGNGTDANGNGLKITTFCQAHGGLHYYRLPRSGVYAKPTQ